MSPYLQARSTIENIRNKITSLTLKWNIFLHRPLWRTSRPPGERNLMFQNMRKYNSFFVWATFYFDPYGCYLKHYEISKVLVMHRSNGWRILSEPGIKRCADRYALCALSFLIFIISKAGMQFSQLFLADWYITDLLFFQATLQYEDFVGLAMGAHA